MGKKQVALTFDAVMTEGMQAALKSGKVKAGTIKALSKLSMNHTPKPPKSLLLTPLLNLLTIHMITLALMESAMVYAQQGRKGNADRKNTGFN